MAQKQVLVIEDDKDIRELVTELLSSEGFNTISAGDGIEGLEYLKEASPLPDVIVLDLIMPRMDGYKFLEKRKLQENLQKIPVIVMTANQMPNQELTGIAAFLRKPLNIESLVSSINKIL